VTATRLVDAAGEQNDARDQLLALRAHRGRCGGAEDHKGLFDLSVYAGAITMCQGHEGTEQTDGPVGVFQRLPGAAERQQPDRHVDLSGAQELAAAKVIGVGRRLSSSEGEVRLVVLERLVVAADSLERQRQQVARRGEWRSNAR